MKQTIELIPVIRDCGYNEGIAKQDPKYKGKKIIVDYEVHITGEHRATFIQWSPEGLGYRLRSAGRLRYTDINVSDAHQRGLTSGGNHVYKKNLVAYIHLALNQGLIPTLQEILEADRKAERSVAAVQERRRQELLEAHRETRLQQSAQAMRDFLAEMIARGGISERTYVKRAQDLIAAANPDPNYEPNPQDND